MRIPCNAAFRLSIRRFIGLAKALPNVERAHTAFGPIGILQSTALGCRPMERQNLQDGLDK